MSITQRVKRSLVLGAAGAMVLSLLPAGIAAADVIDTDDLDACAGSDGLIDFNDSLGFFASDIECMAAYGVTIGDTDGNFNSTDSVTRQQMALFIARLATQALNGDTAIPESDEDAFDDIADVNPAEARDAINFLASLDIVEGDGEGTYNPDGIVSRQQMASFIARAHVALEVDFTGFDSTAGVFGDEDDIAAVHLPNVLLLADVGVVEGDVSGDYNPGNPVTRGQMSAFVVRSIAVLDGQGLWNGEFVVVDTPGVAPSVTEAPDLVGVDIVSDDTTRTQVHFTFDDEVQPVGLQPGDFHLLGWNGAQIDANQVRRLDQVVAGGATNVIRAAFTKGANGFINADTPAADTVPRLDDVVAAGVDQAAVLGLESDIESPERAISLGAAQVPGGFQYVPTATEVTNVSSANDRLDIVFSRDIELTATETQVTLYLQRTVDPTGEESGVSGEDIVTRAATISSTGLEVVSDDTLRVSFGDGNLTGTDASNIRVVAIPASTVQTDGDADAQNTLQTLSLAQDGATSDPDLVDVELDYGNDQATFTFSEAIERGDANIVEGLFQLHYAGSSGAGTGDFQAVASGLTWESDTNTTVTVQFADGAVTKDVIRAGAAQGAVTATDGTFALNPTKTLGIAQTFDGLETIGPDLQEVVVDVTQRNPIDDEVLAYDITYVFDTVIEDIAGDVTLFAADGSSVSVPVTAGTINDDSRGWNTITFTAGSGADFQLNVAIDAVAATIGYNAVEADATTQRANVVNGKDGVGNYGQGINITPPS